VKVIRGSHNCSRLQNNSAASAPWVAGHLLEDVKANPIMDIKVMTNTLMSIYGMLRPKHILRIAKNKIIEMLKGKQEEG